MSPEVMGVEMTPNVLRWERDQRRVGSMLVLAVAVVVVLAGVGTWFFAKEKAAILYWVLVGLLALVLVLMVIILFVGPRKAAEPMMAEPAMAEAAPEAGDAAYAPPAYADPNAPPAAPAGPQVLTLRCGDCGTIFEVTDTGERPLYHTCPGCGAEGALRDVPVAEAAPAPAPEPAYAPPYPEAAQPAPAPASVAAAPPTKKLKLRCGGCKEVFALEDPGTRPLRHACPHCGRMGEIK